MAWGFKRNVLTSANTANTQADWPFDGDAYVTTILISNTSQSDPHICTVSSGGVELFDAQVDLRSQAIIPVHTRVKDISYTHDGPAARVRFAVFIR